MDQQSSPSQPLGMGTLQGDWRLRTTSCTNLSWAGSMDRGYELDT